MLESSSWILFFKVKDSWHMLFIALCISNFKIWRRWTSIERFASRNFQGFSFFYKNYGRFYFTLNLSYRRFASLTVFVGTETLWGYIFRTIGYALANYLANYLSGKLILSCENLTFWVFLKDCTNLIRIWNLK